MRTSRMGNFMLYVCLFVLFRALLSIPNLSRMIARHAILMPIVILITIVVLMFIQLKMVDGLASLRPRPGTAGLIALVALAVIVVMAAVTMRYKIKMPVLISSVQTLKDLALILFAISIGYMISFVIREPNIIIPVAMFAAFADLWGVTSGPLSVVLSKSPEILNNVAVHIPTPVAGFPIALIGMGDFLFLALFFGVVYRFSLNEKGTFWITYALLTLTMIGVIMSNVAVPALVPMGIAVIGANYKSVKLEYQEKLAILYLLLIFFVVLLFMRMHVLQALFS